MNASLHTLAALILGLMVIPSRSVGQRLDVSPAFPSTSPAVHHVMADSVRVIPRTYWVEAGLVGAAVLGILGYEIGGLYCEGGCTGSRISGIVVGGSLGFTVGALVGGQFPKGGVEQ